MIFFKKLKEFLKNIVDEERIPMRDKKKVLILLVLVASPVDLIPDWYPVIGLFDDLVYIAFILDYFFFVLDSRILLSLFPWNMKVYARLKAMARGVQFLVPNIIKNKLWSYEADLY